MKVEVCQLHKKISLGLRHGFSELALSILLLLNCYNDIAAIYPQSAINPLLRIYKL
jgi:hypothetical protein